MDASTNEPPLQEQTNEPGAQIDPLEGAKEETGAPVRLQEEEPPSPTLEHVKAESSPQEPEKLSEIENIPKAKELEDRLSLQRVMADEGAKKKEDVERPLILFPITSQRRQEIEKLFTPPPNYRTELKLLLEGRRIGIVHGPDFADRTMCAEHLALLLTRQMSFPKVDEETGDPYIAIEQQVEELLGRIHPYPEYSRAITLRDILDLNLRRTRTNAEDNPELRFERNQILSQLNNIGLSTLGLALKQMRQDGAKETKRLHTVEVFDWAREDNRPLAELVTQMEEGHVYIARRPVEFDPRFGDQLVAVAAQLVKCNATLIFVQTIVEPPLHFKEACYVAAYPPLDTSEERSYVTEVMRKYFLYFGSVIPAETADLLDELVTIYLKSRFPIASLIDEFRSLGDEATKEQILAVAEGMGKLDARYARHRFQSWSYNHQLYAMLVVLFIDVPRPILDRIYIAAVSDLRDSGVTTLQDPRQFGMDDLLQNIRVQEDDRRIYFQYAAIEAEVERQIDNHHHLLWSLLKIILGWVDQYRAPEYWQLRKSLGAALGRMGLHHTVELADILDSLARHSSGGVVAVAGYALDRICRIAPDKHEIIVQILRRWTESGEPDLMWAAGASIWRIYDSLIEMVESDNLHHAQRGFMTLDTVSEILTSFVRTFKHFNGAVHYQLWQKAKEEKLSALASVEFVLNNLTAWAAANLDAILHAVRQIAWKHPARMVAQIRSWLQAEESDNQHSIGLLAGYQLFETNSRPDVRLSAAQQLPLLGLIQPLLMAEEEFAEKERTVDMVVQALLHWVTHTDWSEQIQAHLLYLLNRSTSEISDLLCESIARYWLASDQPIAAEIGRALLVRAYAIQGTALDMPGCHTGLILLDAADNARANQEGINIGLAFYHRLAPQLDLHLRRMGDRQLQLAPGQPTALSDLQPYHALPAVMMPPLEASALPRLAFILALTWDKVIDACDLAESDAKYLAVGTFGDQALADEALWPKEAKVIAIQRDGRGGAALLETVNQLLARSLTNQSAAAWWTALQPYFAEQAVALSEHDVEQVAHQLQAWISRLDQLEHCRYPNDLMRVMLYATGWLAKVDLAFCVATLQRWLESNESNQRIVGTACGRFLFTLFQARESPPPVEQFSQLLQIAPCLGQQNWDAAQTVLQAAHRWSANADWQRRLLLQPNGAAGELITMIDKTATTYNKQMARLFETWMTDEPTEEEEERQALSADFVAQLRLRLALSSRQPLSELLTDHAYALILVDTAVHNPKKRRRLANIAAKVIDQLSAQLPKSRIAELQVLVYWLGCDHLLAGPSEKPTVETLLPTGVQTYPRLFGPLLERFAQQQLSFVCLFTDELPNDAEDWRHSELHRHILFYADEPRPTWATTFTVLPKEEGDEEKIVTMLTNYLLKHAGG